MTQQIRVDEFYGTARGLFRKLRNWSGEALSTASDDSRGYLRSQVDTGRMAALRRGRIGNGKPVATVAWVIEPCIPREWPGDSIEYLALYRAALLYTVHPHSTYMQEEPRYGSPITRAFRKANGAQHGSDDESRANDRRINFLLDARPDELYERLARVIVPLMNKSDQPVDWIQLARDLRDWDETVKLRWSRGWYGGQRFMAADNEESTTPESSTVEA